MGMIKLKQFYTLNIQDFEEQDFPLPYHSQNYYELVYIYRGGGVHLLNNTNTMFEAGDLLVISQEDVHHFEPNSSTRIIAIKFTNSYFSSNGQHFQGLGASPENMMNNKILKEIRLSFDAEQKIILRQTVDNILLYNQYKDASTSPMVFYQILSIFGMIKEVMPKISLNISDHLPAKEKLTAYIHQHIYDPEKIKVEPIAAHFNISGSYFSSYFKRRFDMSFREYVNQYRMQLIEQRLASGRVSIKEISNEFGFNDESHFSHYYKNKRGISPSGYAASKRRQHS
ncbi:putative AraC-family regulatory protein [Pedobacter sp. BAL39]|uniref:AraC family transcriptional regulator n=1 Tax=Pedobacter sp. BAL39 TaxID=391596 RepID=UPI0001559D97|nr:AraC family transcriptional regulator [Pedobacter sp. BAL39]EDM38099.1 putative AraC-family regulatory protein [Pedobacter sp. BAL39]